MATTMAATKDLTNWRERLRTFHLTGRVPEAARSGQLHPAAVARLNPAARLDDLYPIFHPAAEAPAPLPAWLRATITPARFPATSAHVPAVTAALRESCGGSPAVAMEEAREPALDNLNWRFQQEGVQGWNLEAGKLRTNLPKGFLFNFTAGALPLLHAAALAAARKPARDRFYSNAARLRDRLHNMLAAETAHAPEPPESLAFSLGVEGQSFLDAAALAGAFRRASAGPLAMSAERRARVENTLAVLDRALDEAGRSPSVRIFSSEAGPEGLGAFGGEFRASDDAFAAALGFCDQILSAWTRLLRAVRVAALEVEGAYDPARHDEILDRFEWQSASDDELSAMPAVVVLERAARLAQASLTSFGRLVRSGRPVQILAPATGLDADDLSGVLPDFGYLAMAHREAFVLQSSMAEPEHLLDGLRDMAATLRPAVAVVAVPPAGEDLAAAWTQCALMTLSNSFPLFRYHPDEGETWADRFRLLEAGQGDPWRRLRVAARNAAGEAAECEEALTPAHAAALVPAFRDQFAVIPQDAWNDEQMELGQYLEKYAVHPPQAIPYLWILDEQKVPQRAVITRELVNVCRDRGRAWRIFQELAGTRNAYVERAVAQVRKEMEESAKAQDGAVLEQARMQGATEIVARLMGLVVDPGSLATLPAVPQAPPATVLAPAPPAVQAAAAPAAAQAEPATEEEPPSDPYIDSMLCTSCNDCFKINQRVFAYNENKQAYIADAAAGTFAELVKAAEACPAKCIHPGAPRAGDRSATPAMVARAAKFR